MRNDAITPSERLRPPSRLAVFVEERYLQRKLRAAKQAMLVAESLVVHAKHDVAHCRAHIFEIQDTMRLRGFEVREASGLLLSPLDVSLASAIGIAVLLLLGLLWGML